MGDSQALSGLLRMDICGSIRELMEDKGPLRAQLALHVHTTDGKATPARMPEPTLG